MDVDALCSRYPSVYHMATLGSWPSIQRRGLLSTSALLDLFEIAGDERQRIEATRRPESVTITHAAHGSATIRDQKPLHDSMLQRCLQGKMTVEQWHRLLNGRVFFWVDENRLNVLRQARAYRDERQTVIFADTRKLVERYGPRIRLAHINTGATRSVFHYRDFDTFRAIEDFSKPKVVELTVDYSVPDLADFVVSVENIGGADEPRRIWP
jgi:Family of unknown function (DUF7002)